MKPKTAWSELPVRRRAREPIDQARAAGIRYFASGSNSPGEILGLAAAGLDVGIAIQELHSDGVQVIAEAVAAYPDTKVFADSGAFSEVDFPGGVPTVTRPIDDGEWRARLAAYESIASRIGPQLYAVAPDCIAHQWETLTRLADYADLVRRVAAHGAHILVPCQKGELSLIEFWALAVETLAIPLDQLVMAVPLKKDATSTADYAELLAGAVPRPHAVHLLGLGPKGKRFWEIVEATPPGITILCDSVAITSLVGRTNGPGGGPRALTAAQDAVADELAETLYSSAQSDPCRLDWTEAEADPSAWMDPAARRATAKRLGLAGADARAFTADPTAWVHTDDRWAVPLVSLAIGTAWEAWIIPVSGKGSTGKGTVEYRKSQGIVRVFGWTGEQLAFW